MTFVSTQEPAGGTIVDPWSLAILPAAAFYQWHLRWDLSPWWIRGLALGAAAVPAYLIFAHLLMALSAAGCRLLGWRPVAGQDMPIADLGWPLLDWGRYSICSHVVRLLAGTALRATPMWVWYLRLDGASIGRRVWVNSLGTTDHCLLAFGDDVVISAGAHLSGDRAPVGMPQRGVAPLPDQCEHGLVLDEHDRLEVRHAPGVGMSQQPIEQPRTEPAPEARIDRHSQLAVGGTAGIAIGQQRVARLGHDPLPWLTASTATRPKPPSASMPAQRAKNRLGGAPPVKNRRCRSSRPNPR